MGVPQPFGKVMLTAALYRERIYIADKNDEQICPGCTRGDDDFFRAGAAHAAFVQLAGRASILAKEDFFVYIIGKGLRDIQQKPANTSQAFAV